MLPLQEAVLAGSALLPCPMDRRGLLRPSQRRPQPRILQSILSRSLGLEKGKAAMKEATDPDEPSEYRPGRRNKSPQERSEPGLRLPDALGRMQPTVHRPVRYLLMPVGQGLRHRPVAGTVSHVGTTWYREDMPLSQRRDFRRTLCGRMIRRQTKEDRKWVWIRYYHNQKIEWDRVTCSHCLKLKDKLR